MKTPKIQKFHSRMVEQLDYLVAAQLKQSEPVFNEFVNKNHATIQGQQLAKNDYLNSIPGTPQKIPKIIADQIQISRIKDPGLYLIRKDILLDEKLNSRVDSELKDAKYNFIKIQKERKKR